VGKRVRSCAGPSAGSAKPNGNYLTGTVKVQRWDRERVPDAEYRDGNNLLGAILTLLRPDEPDNRVVGDLRMAK
jgi:hypothetical protein